MTARAFAAAAGVEDDLVAEWERSQPDLPRRSEDGAANLSPKAWRYVGEMEEIAASFAAVGLPAGFHAAAAEAYTALAGRRDAAETTITDVVAALLGTDRDAGADRAGRRGRASR